MSAPKRSKRAHGLPAKRQQAASADERHRPQTPRSVCSALQPVVLSAWRAEGGRGARRGDARARGRLGLAAVGRLPAGRGARSACHSSYMHTAAVCASPLLRRERGLSAATADCLSVSRHEILTLATTTRVHLMAAVQEITSLERTAASSRLRLLVRSAAGGGRRSRWLNSSIGLLSLPKLGYCTASRSAAAGCAPREQPQAAARCGAPNEDLSHRPPAPLAMHSRHKTNSPYGGERLFSLESERAEAEA